MQGKADRGDQKPLRKALRSFTSPGPSGPVSFAQGDGISGARLYNRRQRRELLPRLHSRTSLVCVGWVFAPPSSHGLAVGPA